MDAQLKALPTLPVRARTVSGCVNSANLNILRSICSVHGYPARRAARGADPDGFTAIVLNLSRRRFGGPAGAEPQSPGEPGPRRGGPLIASPSRSNLSAPGLRPANARYQLNAVAQGSASRSGLTLLSLPLYSPNLNLIERLWKFVKHRAFCGRCQPRGSRRSFNHSRRKAEVADDAQVPAIRRCFTHGRVRYSPWMPRGFSPRGGNAFHGFSRLPLYVNDQCDRIGTWRRPARWFANWPRHPSKPRRSTPLWRHSLVRAIMLPMRPDASAPRTR